MATQQNGTLASTLNKPLEPFSAVRQINRGATAEERGRIARGLKEPFMREESAAREGALRAEAEAKKAQIAKEIELETGYVNKLEEAQRKFESAYMAPMPERKITEFDANAGLELAGLTALMGAFAGSLSGRAGLRAMEGVSRGYKEGREDLYNRELKIYEDEVARYKDKISQAKTIYDNALKLEGARRGQGLVELKKLDPLLQDGMILAKVKQGDVVGAGKTIDEAIKLGNEIEVAKIRAANSKAKTLPSELQKTFEKIGSTSVLMNRVNNSAKPEYFGILPVEKASRMLMKLRENQFTEPLADYLEEQYKITPEQILWWKRYDQYISKVRNELFGATLTQAEKENFDRTVISPATEPKIARQFLAEQIQGINDAINREIAKGRSIGVDEDVMRAYLLGEFPGMPREGAPAVAPAQPTADNTAAIQRALQASNIPYEPDKYTYGIENGRVFREAK